MSESSVRYDFYLNPYFWDIVNKSNTFSVDDMDGENQLFKFKFYSSCPADIENCIDSNGYVISNASNGLVECTGESEISIPDIALLYSDTNNNGGCVISLADESTEASTELGDVPINVQAIMLGTEINDNFCMISYARNNVSTSESGTFILPFTGAVVKVSHCGSE